MHIVSLSRPTKMGETLGELPAGEWLMSDQNAFQVGLIAERGSGALSSWTPPPKKTEIKSILLIRSGAIGDLLFLSPCVAELKAKYPGCTVTLACFPKHHAIFKDSFDGLVGYPLSPVGLVGFDWVVPLEDLIEVAGMKHATDAFAEALGVEVKDYRPIYKVSDNEKAWADFKYPKKKKRVGIQMRASTKNRDYPMPLWQKVVDGLLERGWEVFLFGSKGQIPPLPKNAPAHLYDMSGTTFRETAALLATCDAFCGVDSSLVNLCPALDVPAVGLYGPFPWQARTSKAPKTQALTGSGECSPCNWLSLAGRHFPPNQACSRNGYCHVLADIKPERIIAKVDALK